MFPAYYAHALEKDEDESDDEDDEDGGGWDCLYCGAALGDDHEPDCPTARL